MLYRSECTIEIYREAPKEATEENQEQKPARRLVRALVSTTAIDNHGTIILTEGIDLERYTKNPILIWSHDRYAPPIGRAVEIKKTLAGLEMVFEIADTEAGREVYTLIEGGFLSGFSIGGRMLECAYSWQPESEWGEMPDFARSAMREKKCDGVVKRLLVTEVSCCNVPSNPETLGKVLRALGLGEPAGEPQLANLIARMEALLARLEPQAEPAAKPEPEPTPDQVDQVEKSDPGPTLPAAKAAELFGILIARMARQ